MKKSLLLAIAIAFNAITLAQTAEVIISVDWPQWSTENKVELYDPNGMLLQTIDNGYDGSGVAANPYNETTTAVNYPVNSSTTAGYYVIVYDTYGDGWNGNGSLNISADGQSALFFDGNFDTSATNSEITQTIYFAIENPEPGDSIFDLSGNNYIEYIKGNLPIIISAPHGGTITSGALPNRGCGTIEPDDNTAILIRAVQDEIFAQTGGYAHVIINNLNRIKLDPNREVNEATCNNSASGIDNPLYYWNAWHSFIDDASAEVEADYGKGLYIDLHGQSHTVPRIEIGYAISRADINNNNAGHLNTVSGSTITHLSSNNIGGLTQEDLITGNTSLGALFHNAPGTFYASQNYPGCGRNGTNGYRATPSNYTFSTGNCDDRKPNNANYFDGDFYNNQRHGSGNGASDGLGGDGFVDGIMTEVNRRVRDVGSTLEPFAIDYANVVLDYIDTHYNDFTAFSYDNASYNSGTDSNPTPTLTNMPTAPTFMANGIYTSSPVGLSIDENTGTIDLMASTPGNYTVTYSVGPSSAATAPNRYYQSTQNVEVVGSTLSTITFNRETFKLFPNPANNYIQFQSNKEISKVKVFNLLGQEIQAVETNTRQANIDLSKLANGSYLMTFYIDGELVNSKMIIKN